MDNIGFGSSLDRWYPMMDRRHRRRVPTITSSPIDNFSGSSEARRNPLHANILTRLHPPLSAFIRLHPPSSAFIRLHPPSSAFRPVRYNSLIALVAPSTSSTVQRILQRIPDNNSNNSNSSNSSNNSNNTFQAR